MASEGSKDFSTALFNALGESNLKVPRLSHGVDPFEYWSREQIEQAILDAAAAVDGDSVDVRIVTAYESGFEAGKVEAGDAQWNAAIEALETIDKFEINATDSMVNQVFRLKNIARNALGRVR